MPPKKQNNKASAKATAPATNQGGGIPSDELIFNTLLKKPELVANILTQRSDLLNKLFDPRRDINEECGYPDVVTEQQYRAMYDRELGLRVVNVYSEETWKMMPRIYEDPDPENTTDFENSLDAFENKFHLLHYMQRVDELSGVGYYGVVLWGLSDGLPLQNPVEGSESWEESTGLPSTTMPPERRVLFIRVLDGSLVKIASYETDPTKPRYGMPLYYNMVLADPRTLESDAVANPADLQETKVHWSRITHIADNRKTNEVLGMPRMQAVWNRLYDLRKVLGGSGEMFWKGGFPGVSLETQPGFENAEMDEDSIQRAMFNYMNGLQRYIAMVGMKATSLAPQIADPVATFETQIKAICITLGVPYRVFMGIEEGVVSGDQVTKAWDGRLKNRQERYVTPMLIDPIIQRLIDYGVIAPTQEPRGWVVDWPDLTVPSDKDKAEVAVLKTEAMVKYTAGGVDTLMAPMEFLTIVVGWPENVAESIIEGAVAHIESISDEDEITPGHGPTPPQLQEDAVPGEGETGGEEEEEE